MGLRRECKCLRECLVSACFFLGASYDFTLPCYSRRFNRGRLVKDRATGQPKLNCRNWECGVLVPVTTPKEQSKGCDSIKSDLKEDGAAKSESQLLSPELFRNTVPVPMKLPAAQLNAHNRPWFS